MQVPSYYARPPMLGGLDGWLTDAVKIAKNFVPGSSQPTINVQPAAGGSDMMPIVLMGGAALVAVMLLKKK